MKLGDYFDRAKGLGVLSTADSSGRVDSAVYARPHVVDEQTIAFIMADRLTHANLQSNPHAVYLFKEEGPKYNGKRLYLTRIREEKDSPMIEQIRRKKYPEVEGQYEGMSKFLVFFRVDKVLPLIGDKE
ncbi:MAG TPA: pyridoxamine 5'-phosphate oxidase family protein [Syntrophales bacterium]|nr:pyridoxamine 5'-phosphate oxidase family protein [Syntrophales bacterium]HOX94599.1 pyridoxamine 5'-phosphate oxidase family protein [Syntrophales bacterium]HPI57251.1 pyridoxamine 5'-phosphate oxidase family protein [Syntrophales bacterium]HPN25131.1 pyridoxamine 5'-phosphate oxidase family protein [Syntrophales bacterium]HQM29449.1 pyridoxamine 5'-phosphate oxidase family protein [Syntrophales bacterium]